jgi:hypothetical protein
MVRAGGLRTHLGSAPAPVRARTQVRYAGPHGRAGASAGAATAGGMHSKDQKMERPLYVTARLYCTSSLSLWLRILLPRLCVCGGAQGLPRRPSGRRTRQGSSPLAPSTRSCSEKRPPSAWTALLCSSKPTRTPQHAHKHRHRHRHRHSHRRRHGHRHRRHPLVPRRMSRLRGHSALPTDCRRRRRRPGPRHGPLPRVRFAASARWRAQAQTQARRQGVPCAAPPSGRP